MKILPFLALFAVLISTSSYVSSKIDRPEVKATPSTTFKQFRVHRQGTDVALTWSVTSPAVVQFTIERSYDGEFFESISSMGCSGTATHQFRDANPYPGTSWYRIVATKADGTTENSVTETVRIVKRG